MCEIIGGNDYSNTVLSIKYINDTSFYSNIFIKSLEDTVIYNTEDYMGIVNSFFKDEKIDENLDYSDFPDIWEVIKNGIFYEYCLDNLRNITQLYDNFIYHISKFILNLDLFADTNDITYKYKLSKEFTESNNIIEMIGKEFLKTRYILSLSYILKPIDNMTQISNHDH